MFGFVLAGTAVAGAWGAGPVFRVALVSEPPRWEESFDPRWKPLELALSEGLVTLDPTTGQIRPGLAESWTLEGRRWRFALRAARWSDGSPLIAQDVAEAWARVQRSEAAGSLVPSIESMDASQPRVFSVTFARPLPSLALLASGPWASFSSDWQTKGNGPLRILSRIPGQQLLAVKNPYYWNAKAVVWEQVVFRFTEGAAAADTLYRRGEVDWVAHGWGPGTPRAEGLKDAVVSPGWGLVYLRLNLNRVPWNALEVRKALAAPLDRGGLVANLRGAPLWPASGLVPGRTGPRSGATPDLTRALARTGAPGLITILHTLGESNQRLVEALDRQWRQAGGLTTQGKGLRFPAFLDQRAAGLFEGVLSGWLGDYADPLSFLEGFRTGHPQNVGGFSDPEVDALLDRIPQLLPGKERDRLVAEVETRVQEAVPVIPLAAYASINQINPSRWKGWVSNPLDLHPWTHLAPQR